MYYTIFHENDNDNDSLYDILPFQSKKHFWRNTWDGVRGIATRFPRMGKGANYFN